jgi:poly(3-hydroxybutyrate) depolymerase
VPKFVFVLSFLTCFRCAAWAQSSSGPQDLTFFSGIDDSDQPYSLYLPKKLDRTKRYPLVMMLHGAYSNHRLALRRVFGKGNGPGETDVEATRYFPPFPDVDYIVAAPLARGTLGYQGIMEQDVFDVLNDVESRFPIDPDRVYLTGLSMGGGGTLSIGLTHPDIWAAIAPVCPAPPEKTSDLAPNALNLAVHFFQGDTDQYVPVQQTRDWVAKMRDLGTKDVEYSEYPGVKHNAWDNAYANAQIFHWFDGFKRDLWPKRVRYVTSDYEHQKAYWIVVDRLTPGTLASIDARFTGTNQVDVKTSGLGGFSLMLYGHPSFEAGKPLTVTVDGAAIHIPPITSTAGFAKTASGWKYGDAGPADDEKQQGSEGPLRSALSRRHIYVYGSADNPSKDELAKREDEAVHDASWVATGTKLELWLRAVADKDVRSSDWASSDMILLGNAKTNSVITGLTKELPMQLAPDVNGWNLTYVWPHEEHYVVISSGADIKTQGQPAMLYFLPATPFPSVLFGLQDFVLFHNRQKVVEGRFTQRWKIPKRDAEKLKASGVVSLRQGASE